MNCTNLIAFGSGLLLALIPNGLPASITVDARSCIFDSGDAVATRGILPVEIPILSGATYAEFSATGWTKAGTWWPVVGPDGGTQGPLSWQKGTNLFSADGISGIKHNRFLFLTGVFLTDNSPPSGAEPARLDFTVIGSSFTDLSPLIAQSFFIGDGLTGQGTGAVQRFHIPVGATRLFLGFADSDSFGWPNGKTPFAYADNTGALEADVQFRPVPEPASLAVWSTLSIAALIAARRRQRNTQAMRFALLR